MSPPPPTDDPYEGFQEVSARLMEIYGYYPSPGDRHVAEFFPFFLRDTGNGLGYGVQSGLDMTNEFLPRARAGIASPIRPKAVPTRSAAL